MNEPFVVSWKPILHMFVVLVWTLKDPVKLLIFEFLKRRCLAAAFCQRLTVCLGCFFLNGKLHYNLLLLIFECV